MNWPETDVRHATLSLLVRQNQERRRASGNPSAVSVACIQGCTIEILDIKDVGVTREKAATKAAWYPFA